MNKKIIAIVLSVLTAISVFSAFAFADFIKAGDVNGDGKVNAADARLVLRVSASLEALTEEQRVVAEVTGDGKISAADARLILRAAANLDTLPEITTEADSETEEPTTEEPTTEEPTTEEPTTEEPTTEEPTTEEPATDNVVTEYPEAISAFFSGKFYLEGDLSEGDSKSAVIMATNGKKTEVAMDMDGFSMSIYSDSKKIYIKFPYNNKNYYVEMSEEMLDSYGIELDISSLAESLSLGTIEDYGDPTLTVEELDGVEYNVYTFASEDGYMLCFYADENEEIKSLVSKTAEGKIDTQIKLNALSATIPSNMLTVRGYNEGSIFTLMNALMALQ